MLNWQIGKKYRRRNGNISIMTRYFAPSVLPKRAIDFDDGNPVWAENAQRSNAYIGEYDIIEEVKENEMKIEVGKYYKTRNGYKAHILHILDCDGIGNKNIVGYTTSPDGVFWDTVLWTMAGATNNPHMELVEEWKGPKSGVAYVNIFVNGIGGAFNTRSAADGTSVKEDRIACVRIEWKEGQFDD